MTARERAEACAAIADMDSWTVDDFLRVILAAQSDERERVADELARKWYAPETIAWVRALPPEDVKP